MGLSLNINLLMKREVLYVAGQSATTRGVKKILESSELNNYWKTNKAGRLLNLEYPEGTVLSEHPK